MIKLTDCETVRAIYVRREAILSARQLPAEIFEGIGDVSREHGERTRIDTATDMFLVRETIEEGMESN